MDSVGIKPYFKGLNFKRSYIHSQPTKLLLTNNSLSFFHSCFNTFKPSPIHVRNPNPQNPISERSKPICSLSNFFPLLQRIELFLPSKTSTKKWGEGYLQNGGIGMALLSATPTASVRLSSFMATLAGNPTFVSGLFAWMAAQSIKVILNFCVEKKWDLSIMFACGGMPSSHSALCTALTTSVAICHGVADSLFPVCLGFSSIVMYDAIGVRRHAGMQAEVLNMIVEDLFQGHPISKRKLKELLGHTPSQVLAGALLGFLVAFICCHAFFLPI
ncbi:hypothetical protein U1Q18_023721 [Sarracenia purpurea var. burkii]